METRVKQSAGIGSDEIEKQESAFELRQIDLPPAESYRGEYEDFRGMTLRDLCDKCKRLENDLRQKMYRKYGKVDTRLYFRQYVGDGEREDGKKFEIDVMNDYSPAVYYNGKMFMLSWNDIVDLAELAGLFDDEVSV